MPVLLHSDKRCHFINVLSCFLDKLKDDASFRGRHDSQINDTQLHDTQNNRENRHKDTHQNRHNRTTTLR